MAAQLFTLLTVAWLITRLIYELTVASSTTAKWIVLVLLTTVVSLPLVVALVAVLRVAGLYTGV